MKIYDALAIYSAIVGVAFAEGSPDSVIDDKDELLAAAIRSPSKTSLRSGGEKGTVQNHLGVPQAVHETHKDRQLLPNLNPFSYFKELQKNNFEIIDGYIGVETGGCNDQKDLGSSDSKSRDGCRDWCNEKDDCVSFAYSQYGRKCQLSSTCRSPSETVYEEEPDHDGFFLYVKKSKVVKADRVEGYVTLNTGGCKGKNELGTYEMQTAADCAAECNQHDDCVSFEFGKVNRFCSLSKTCNQKSLTVNEKEDPNYWYARASKIENNAENVNTDDFDVLDTGGCGFNGKGRYWVSVKDCADKCLEDDSCVSFRYTKFDGRSCLISTTCDDYSKTVQDVGDNWFLFIKK